MQNAFARYKPDAGPCVRAPRRLTKPVTEIESIRDWQAVTQAIKIRSKIDGIIEQR